MSNGKIEITIRKYAYMISDMIIMKQQLMQIDGFSK